MGFFTADIHDEYNDIVYALSPKFKNFGGAKKCKGEVVTIKLDKHNSELIKLLRDEDGEGKVVVVDVDEEYYAVVGENLMKFAHKNNYAGIIVNGYVRDTLQIKDIPVALYALGTCPRKYMPHCEGKRDIELSFGGVKFKNGDFIYADTDGVVVTHKQIV
ncbi:MAG: ribonuclease E activity regulator RraA [Epsilonproteobacteria bacterium]|nr:ribonuclease E activity regulator RraA [Campylobacterota bacterium]